MPSISFVIPVYKIEEFYLRKCIESLVAIDFRDLEFIFIDDGSPDNCGLICEEYAKRDGRIVVVHKQNEGASSARNTGIAVSRGRYITFVDADDWVESDKMNQILDQVAMSNSDIIMYGQYLDFKNRESIEIRPFDENRTFSGNDEINKIKRMVFVRGYDSIKTSLGSGVVCNTVDKFIKKSLLEKSDLLFDTSIIIAEDNLFYLKVFHLCKSVSYINICAYHYRMRKTSASHIPKEIGYKHLKLFVKEALTILDSQKADSILYTSLYYRCYDLVMEHFNMAYLDVKCGIFEKCRRFSNELRTEPFRTAFKTINFRDYCRRESIRIFLFKIQAFKFFMFYKECRKHLGIFIKEEYEYY